jgi:malonate-semialdehyde dehydrogenase (acetylating)/methylmalonate-semialdehyde dehydrogenase
MIEAGLPPGILNVVNGDKEAVDAILDHPDIKAVGFVGSSRSRNTSMRAARARQARAVLRRRQEPHDRHARRRHGPGVDALIGAGYGSAGERCMAISVAVPVGKKTADRADGES